MENIKSQRISPNGLSKQEWRFTIRGTDLVYTSHFVYNRSTKIEKWADEKPKPLLFRDWCKKYDKEENDYYSDQEYQMYYEKLNPVCQRTKSGKSKLSGVCMSDIKGMPICPDDVASEAKIRLMEELKVIYK